MIPIALDPAKTRIALVGRGALMLRRWQWLRAGGALPVIFSDAPEAEVAALPDLRPALPTETDWAFIDVAWIADLPPGMAEAVADEARRCKVLANVEDVLDHCWFHTPAVVRRGLLTVGISTGGASPAAAGAVRAVIDQALRPEWGPALDDIAAVRAELRAAGAGPAEVSADARSRLAAAGLVARYQD